MSLVKKLQILRDKTSWENPTSLISHIACNSNTRNCEVGWGRAKPRPVQAELFGGLWLQSFVPQALQAFDFEYFDYFVAKRDKAQSKKKLAVKKDTDIEKIDVIDV